nr:variable surface lipoprotein [Mycoplasmopsis bovis]
MKKSKFLLLGSVASLASIPFVAAKCGETKEEKKPEEGNKSRPTTQSQAKIQVKTQSKGKNQGRQRQKQKKTWLIKIKKPRNNLKTDSKSENTNNWWFKNK